MLLQCSLPCKPDSHNSRDNAITEDQSTDSCAVIQQSEHRMQECSSAATLQYAWSQASVIGHDR